MLDVHALEKRWLRYKIKRLLPLITAILILLGSLITGVFLWSSSKHKVAAPTVQPVSTPKPLPKAPTETSDENNSVILEPSMEFMHNIVEPDPTVTQTPSSKSLVQQKVSSITPTLSPSKEIIAPILAPPPPVTKNTTVKNSVPLINKTENKLDITALEARFKQNPNASLGLFIARYHYDHGNFAQAYNYALKTNSMNDKIDESWIIFSKSLVKLDKIDQAKKTLTIYIEQSNSDTAKGLLDSIEKGSFK